MLFLVFFCSGVGGLIYQVVWVRVFANVFGNTIYSASIVVAVFMLGLGVGSLAGGVWADRRYRARPESLLRAFAVCEAAIALLALGLSQLLPHLGDLSARISSYARDQTGWYVLSVASYAGRAAIAIVLLAPITALMGATLSLLIRHLVRRDVQADSWRVAALYGANTLGAACGCMLTDLALVPAYGIRGTQLIAVGFNLAAAAGAFRLAARATPETSVRNAPSRHQSSRVAGVGTKPDTPNPRIPNPESRPLDLPRARLGGVRRDGPGDRLVQALQHSARRIPRGVCDGTRRHPARHRRRRLPGRRDLPPRVATRPRAHGRPGTDGRNRSAGPGLGERSNDRHGRIGLRRAGRATRPRRRSLVQRPAHPARTGRAGCTDGTVLPPRQRADTARRTIRRDARRRALPRQHGRRRRRIAWRRVRAAPGTRHPAHGNRAGARGRSRGVALVLRRPATRVARSPAVFGHWPPLCSSPPPPSGGGSTCRPITS